MDWRTTPLTSLAIVALHLYLWRSASAVTAALFSISSLSCVANKNNNCTATHTPDQQQDDSLWLELILAEDYEAMDPVAFPQSLVALKERGAHRCWHKHSTFLQHLLGVHHILRLWGQGSLMGRVGLFHSAYSNSFVNLALFDPERERPALQSLIGTNAEALVHLFCIIDRQAVVVNTLLKQGYIPKEGLTVPHLRNPEAETVYLSPETLRRLVVFTMADVADQFFGWQDQLFGGGGNEGSMIVPGQDVPAARHDPTALWPGVSRPGLWMSYLSQLGQVAHTFMHETEADVMNFDNNGVKVPPVFDNCTKVLTLQDEAEALDLYWSVATSTPGPSDDNDNEHDERMIQTLQACIQKNPWCFEPHVLLAQKYLHQGDFANAEVAARRALELQGQWGCPYDKRLSFGAWVAWTRVLLQRAKDQEPWPTTSWGVNNLGLVR